MTNGEAVKILGQYDTSGFNFYWTDGEPITAEQVTDAFELAITALQKQIPKPPIHSKTPRYGMGYEYYDWTCPTCGAFLASEIVKKGPHHCICGQNITWEGL